MIRARKLAAIAVCVTIVLSIPATAKDPDEETIADYAVRPVSIRQNYANHIVGMLRPNHPKLTGAQIFECLEGVARHRNNDALKLKMQAITCAVIND